MRKKLIKFCIKVLFIFTYSTYLSFLILSFFGKSYTSNQVIEFKYFNFDKVIYYLKLVFPISTILVSIILSISITKFNFINEIFDIFLKNSSKHQNIDEVSEKLSLKIGLSEAKSEIVLNETALYQNILITGSIGTGKTTGTIYPFINQLLKYRNISGLVLDVKGNMENSIFGICKQNNMLDNLIVIELNGKYKYNPLHKPHLKPYILANRLISILNIFSNKNNYDTYWFDKAENLLTNLIKLTRLYNNGYVTFTHIHNLISSNNILDKKLELVKQLFLSNKFNDTQKYDYNQILTYFKSEYINLDNKISSIILSEISRITSIFVSDIDIENTFCPKKEEINFNGFENIFENNEIVLLKMNIAEYQNLSKVISAYLKLDFQTEILKRKTPIINPSFFICDEYQTYVMENDASFYSLSREYKCINIVSTQSYSSLLSTLNNENNLKVLLQSFVNKIFLRNDDVYTIESAQKLFGKEDKIKMSSSISENANQTSFNYLLQNMQSKKSNISESISSYVYLDNVFDSKDFSQNLKSFEAICYLSNGNSMLKPQRIKLIPYFLKEVLYDQNVK